MQGGARPGLAWMNDSNARRGQEVVLWGTIDAYNYNNVVLWSFRDDGAVEGKYGATALNLPGAESIAHMHTPIWRLDIDLDGFQGDSVHRGQPRRERRERDGPLALVSTETRTRMEGRRVYDAARS